MLSQDEFRQLRIKGQLCGGLIMLIGTILMFVQQNGLFFLGSLVLFWMFNYGFIYLYIGLRFVEHD